MDKLMTLGIALSAIDQFSKPMAKVQQSLGAFANRAERLSLGKINEELGMVEQKTASLNRLKINMQTKLNRMAEASRRLSKVLREVESDISSLNKKRFALQKKFDDGKMSAKAFAKESEALEKSIKRLSSKKLHLDEELKRTDRVAEKTAYDINRIERQIVKLDRKKLGFTNRLKQLQVQTDIANDRVKKLGLTISKYAAFSAAAGRMMIGKLSETVTAYKEVQKAQGDITSLGMDESGITKVTKAAKEMTNQYAGVTMPAFIRASYDIKSGIASLSDEGVANFTKMATLTARATKSTIEEMTKLYALGYGIFKNADESDIDFGKRFSASVAQAVQDFRTDGRDLVEGISNIGAVAKAMGVSLTEELSVIGNAKDAFSSASEAGTAYRAFLSNVVNAQKKLGISLVDTKGKLLPMRMVLEQLKKKFGDLDAVEMKQLKDAFGSEEAVKIITALINKTDKLANSERKLMGAKLSTVESMAQARNRGEEFTLMMQRLGTLLATIGERVSPLFDTVANKIGTIAKSIDEFIVNNPFGKWIVIGVAGVAAFAVVAGLAGVALGALGMWIGYVGKAMMLFHILSKAAALGMVLLQGAMSPIILIATAIAGVVYLIINNWEMLSRWFGSFWEWTKEVFSSGASYLGNIFTSPIVWIKKMWGKLLSWLGEKVDAIKGLVNKLGNFVGYGDVFDININAKGGSESKQERFYATAKEDKNNKEIPKIVKKIADATHKLTLPTPQIAPLVSAKPIGKRGKRGTSFEPRKTSGSEAMREYNTRQSSSKERNYNINIRIVGSGTDEIASKLSSILPPLIKDIEAGMLTRGMYDL